MMKKKTENETATFLISEKLSASYKYGFLLTNPNQVISLIIINSLFLKKKKLLLLLLKLPPTNTHITMNSRHQILILTTTWIFQYFINKNKQTLA